MDKKVKIYVCYHKESLRIKNDVFEPIQLGRDLGGVVLEDMIGDNTGKNISYKQSLYAEMSAPYWMLHNKLDEYDYLGICHYRRIYSFKKPCKWINIKEKVKCRLAAYLIPFCGNVGWLMDWNAHYVSNDAEFVKMADTFAKDIQRDVNIGKYDLYALTPVRNSGLKFGIAVGDAIGGANLKLFEEILKNKYPEYYSAFKEACQSNKLYYANMTIMKKELFKEYAEMMFDLLETHEKLAVEKGIMIDPMKEKVFPRGEGYLAELLTSAFVSHKIKQNRSSVKLLYAVLYNFNKSR